MEAAEEPVIKPTLSLNVLDGLVGVTEIDMTSAPSLLVGTVSSNGI